MKSLPPQAILGGAALLVTALVAAAVGSFPAVAAVLSVGLACVAFVAQSQRLRDENRLVYRPVYARRQTVQRRVRSDD